MNWTLILALSSLGALILTRAARKVNYRHERANIESLSPPETKDVAALLVQYERCAADVRNYDAMLWQIPSVGALVLYAVAFVASPKEGWDPYVALIGSFAGVVAMLSLTAALYKIRLLQMGRVASLKEIGLQIINGTPFYAVPMETIDLIEKYPDDPGIKELIARPGYRVLCKKTKAFHWLLFAMWFFVFVSLSMFLWTYVVMLCEKSGYGTRY